MTDLILLSGFLGAGKTTLLQQLLHELNSAGKQVAVVSNDFGPVNVDAELIELDGPVIEISDGSMFCSCREGDFVAGLLALSHYPLDYVLVEASGLGDPANLGDLLEIAQRDWTELNYLGTVCVVDAEEIVDLADLLQVVPRQIAYADVMLANKADLVSAEELAQVVEWLAEQNPLAEVITTVRCQIELQRVLALLELANPASHDATTNTCDDRPTSTWLHCEDELPLTGLEGFLADLAPRTHRIKGFLRTDSGTTEVSCVGKRIEMSNSTHTPKQLGLVLITSQARAFHSDIVRSWERRIRMPMALG